MRRLALVAAAFVLPLLPAAPAFAVDHVICVGTPVGTCDQTLGTIPLAIAAANVNGLANTILVGPGTYSDGPYTLDGGLHALTLKGSGQGSTILTLPSSATSQPYVFATHATVQALTITMSGGADSSNDQGLWAGTGSTVDHVAIDGTGTTNATGLHAQNATVANSSAQMPLGTDSRAFYSEGGNTVTDIVLTGTPGYVMSSSASDSVSRAMISTDSAAVTLDGGTINLDDAVIDLGTSTGTRLQAANFNNGTTPKTINANHVTIVGGTAGSRGAWAYAATPGALQQSTITIANSIIRGQTTSLRAEAGNNGAQGGVSNATINVSFSDWTLGTQNIGANGAGGVVVGAGNVNVDPAFANPAGGDYHLAAGSPVVDLGDPTPGGPTVDRAGNARVTDGDGNGTPVRDMGAYERAGVSVPVVDTTAPETTITSKPPKRVTKRRVRFGFAASETGASFACKLDKRPWRACTSPARFRIMIGRHRFLVRATDAAGNTDATPGLYRFRRVR